MRIETLGKPRIILDDRVLGPEHEMALALVLALLEAAPRPLPRSAVCELLWPEITRERASHNLRQALYKLRQHGLALTASADELSLPTGIVWDVEERLAADAPSTDPDLPWVFLADYEPRVSRPYTVRIERWRDRVHRRLVEKLLAALRQSRSRTQWTKAVAHAVAILAIDPLNEEGTLTLAEGRAVQGSKTEAVALLDRYLAAIDGLPGELAIQPMLLRRRITERVPAALRDRSGWKLLVGRDALLESFGTHMRRAREGVGSIISMWGEPGVGKTRLVRELNAVGALEGWSLVTISCEPTWPDRPLCALEVMTSTMLLQPGALGVDPRAHRALMRLTRMDPDDEPLPQGPEDTAYRQRLLRTSVLDLIDAVSSERPLLIAVDDAQWLDPTSLPFYSMAVEHAADRRVAWVFVSQQREQLPKMATGGSRALVARVPPLSEEESYRLLGELVHGQPPADRPELLRRAAGVSNGNPLYVHTLATHWLSTGDTSELPPSLEALIEQRLDTLSAAAMRALQVCALLGRHATVARAEAVLQLPRGVLLESMDQLHALGFLETVDDAPLVRHGIMATRSVGRASKATVVLLHRYIAEVLEPVAREGKDAALLVACAEHLREANLEQRGVELIEGTVRQLLRSGSMDAAWAVVRALEAAIAAGAPSLQSLADRTAVEIAYAQGDRALVTRLSDALLTRDPPPDRRTQLYGQVMNAWSTTTGGIDGATHVSRLMRLTNELREEPQFLAPALTQALIVADLQMSWTSIASVLTQVRRLEARVTDDTEAWMRTRILAAFYSKDAETAMALALTRLSRLPAGSLPFQEMVAIHDLTMVARSLAPAFALDEKFARCVERARETGRPDPLLRALLAHSHFLLDRSRGPEAAVILPEIAELSRANVQLEFDSFVASTAWRLMQAKALPLSGPDDPLISSSLSGPLPKHMRAAVMVAAWRSYYWRALGRKELERQAAQSTIRLSTRFASWPRADVAVAEGCRACELLLGADRAARFFERSQRVRFDVGAFAPELRATINDLRLPGDK